MMKRFLSALLCACVLISMTGCAQDQEAPEDLLYSSCADPVQQRFQQRGGVLVGAGGEPGGEQFLRGRRIPPPGTVQLVLCGFVPAVLVCGALLIESGVLQSGIIQPGIVPEFFQPADLFQALRQQQRDGSFGRDAGSLVLLSGPLVDDQAEVPVGV